MKLKIHKIIVTFLTCTALVSAIAIHNNSLVVNAEESNSNVSEESSSISDDEYVEEKIGGVNCYKGEQAKTRAETVSLESKIRRNGYILINTDKKQITDEQLALIKRCKFWFNTYLNPEDEYNWENSKVYFPLSDFNGLMEEFKKKPYFVNYDYCLQIRDNIVVIDYVIWDYKEKAGKLNTEYNDRIPEKDLKTAGYLEINSAIAVKITLRDNLTDQYFAFYVKKDEPYKVKVKAGMYEVVCINTQEISRTDKALTYKGFFSINNNYTEKNPYKLDIQPLIKEHDIKEYDKKTVERFPNIVVRENSYNEDVAVAKSEERRGMVKKIALIVAIVLALIAIVIKGIIILKEKIKAEKELRGLTK